MNSLPTLNFWLETVGALALQCAIVLVAAGIAQAVLRTPRWRRTTWLAALVGLALVLANSLTGIDRQVANWLVTKPKATRQVLVRGNLPVESRVPLPNVSDSELRNVAGLEAGAPNTRSAAPSVVWWPAWFWLAGTFAAAVWALVPRLWLLLVSRHGTVPNPAGSAQRVRMLAARLGLGRPVRVFTSKRLVGPIALGVWRPSVGLPPDFWTANSRAEQDAMLAHELAHLAAQDPFWLALADLLVALLWWHPLVWWARRQFRTACETAADEASWVVEDGPAVLAGCLVALASRWRRTGALGLLGMAGFRSGLGRRVERLLRLQSAEPRRERCGWSRLLLALASVAAVAVAIEVPWWAFPAQAEAGPTLLGVVGEALTSAVPASDEASSQTLVPIQAVAASTESPISSAHVVSIRISAEGRLLLNQREQPLDALQSELQKMQSPSSSFVVRVAAASEAPATIVRQVVEACRKAGITQVSLATQPAGNGEVSPLVQDATLLYASESQLLTRMFRVDPNSLAEHLTTVAGNGATNLHATEALRWLFTAAGVELGETNVFAGGSGAGAFQSPHGKAVFLNAQNGILLVRATLSDLDTIEQVLQMVNAAPPQVMLEARFVEVTDEGGQRTGFDWFLGDVPMSTNRAAGSNAPGVTNPNPMATGVFPSAPAPGSPAATGGVATVTGLTTDPQFREVVAALGKSGTNALRELRGDELDWAGRQAANASNIAVNAAFGTKLTGVLTDEQFRIVLRALEQRSGVDILAAPRVTTLSGRQAQIQVAELKSVLTGVDPVALRPGGATPTTNSSPFTASQVPIGPTLDIIPVVAADGRTIQLTVIPTVTEFLGYDPPPKDAKVRVWEGGQSRLVNPPLPRFRVRQMQTQAQIGDGQTLMLGGLPVEETRLTKDKVPVLGDVPVAGGLFRSESTQSVRKMLLVFVTATVIDPAGNPVHAVNNRSSDPSQPTTP